MNYMQWLNFAEKKLIQNRLNDPFLNPKVDAYFLLQHVTQKSRAQILAFSESELTKDMQVKLAVLLERRYQGEPIAYILGEKEFWSLSLEVSCDTLIPRPDTEVLVEKALELAIQRLSSVHFDGELSILDLGTGTGAIILALASELLPLTQKKKIKFNALGIDSEAKAIELARRNARRNHLSQVQFLQSNWFAQINHQRFDLIVSNPPYIDENDQHLKQGDVRFEPLSALVAKEKGYSDLIFLIQNASYFLKSRGWLILEHGWQQGEKVRSIFAENLWQSIETIRDYSQNERLSLAQL